jgi:uncharacterized protein YqeY
MDHTTREAPGLRAQLAAALPRAMKARDQAAVAALRSTLAALANAEALGVGSPVEPPTGSADVAGAALGVGDTEAVRRALAHHEVADHVLNEATQRRHPAPGYHAAGQVGRADRLRAEAAVIRSFLD